MPFASAARWMPVKTSDTTLAEIVRHDVRNPAARFVAREVEQIVDDALHASRVRLDRREKALAIAV